MQAQMFKHLRRKASTISAITDSEIKISVLIDAAYAELAVRTLHALIRAWQRQISCFPHKGRKAQADSCRLIADGAPQGSVPRAGAGARRVRRGVAVSG
jgi:hypothetical protein